MKIFETIQLFLFGAMLIGVPIAATTLPPGQAFSWATALQQAGTATLILLSLIILNTLIARWVARRRDAQTNQTTVP